MKLDPKKAHAQKIRKRLVIIEQDLVKLSASIKDTFDEVKDFTNSWEKTNDAIKRIVNMKSEIGSLKTEKRKLETELLNLNVPEYGAD